MTEYIQMLLPPVLVKVQTKIVQKENKITKSKIKYPNILDKSNLETKGYDIPALILL